MPETYPPAAPAPDDEIDLLGVLLVVARRRRMIALVAAGVTLLGLALALSLPSTYTANATLVRESAGEMGGMGGGLSALRSFGISVGGESSGLSVDAFPDLLMSREVQLALLADTVYAPSHGGRVLVRDVLLEPTGTGRVLGALTAPLRWMRGGSSAPEEARGQAARGSRPDGLGAFGSPMALTQRDQVALGILGAHLAVETDVENGLMTVAASAGDAHFAAALVDRAVFHLTRRVREIQTQKADQNLAFVKTRLREADAEMRQANGRLASFEDQNRNIQTSRLRVDRDRLQQDLSFKRQVYTELRTEQTRAELERQRSEPVITFVDRPVVPAFPSGPRRAVLVIGSVLVGLALGAAAALAAAYAEGGDVERREKLSELRSVWPARLRRRKGKSGA